MNKAVGMFLLLGLLLMLLIAPFSALSLVMLVLLVSAIGSTAWQLLQTLIGGNAESIEK